VDDWRDVAGQVIGWGRAWSRRNASASCSRQGQAESMRTTRRRCPRAIRAATWRQSVAQRRGLGEGQRALEQGGLGPGDQVRRGQGELDPGGVDRELRRRQPIQAGVLGAADPILDPGMSAVPGHEVRELPDPGVGGETLRSAIRRRR